MDGWPPELMFLRELEEPMKCPICFDLMQAPVLLPGCEHNYCSLCIRRYFSQKEQCPTCGSSASSNQLRSNGIMERTIEQFKKIRSPLRSMCVNKLPQTQSALKSDVGSSPQTLLEERNTPHRRKSARLIGKEDGKDGLATTAKSRKPPQFESSSDSDDSDVQILSEDKISSFSSNKTSSSSSQQQQSILSPSASQNQTEGKPRNIQSKLFVTGDGAKVSAKENAGAKRESALKTASPANASPNNASPLAVLQGRNSKTATTANSSPKVLSPLGKSQSKVKLGNPVPVVEKVPCPVCGVPVVTQSVNRHLDLCLGQQDKQSAGKEKRKPLPKLVYNLLSDKDIRKRLKDLGLMSKGDRQALIKRHHEFTMYHNADCDSIAPKDVTELVKEFEETQKTQMKLMTRSPTSNQLILRFTKDSKQEDIEKAQKEYASQHKDQFKSLIKEARARMRAARKPLTSPTSTAPGSENGAQDGSQEQTESSGNSDTTVFEENTCQLVDGGDMVDGDIGCTFELKASSETKELNCVLESGDDNVMDEEITCQDRLSKSRTASETIVSSKPIISKTHRSSASASVGKYSDVLTDDVVMNKDAFRDTGLSSQMETVSDNSPHETAPSSDIYERVTDCEEENDSDVFENELKSQYVQIKPPVEGKGKRMLRPSKFSWQDTELTELSVFSDRSLDLSASNSKLCYSLDASIEHPANVTRKAVNAASSGTKSSMDNEAECDSVERTVKRYRSEDSEHFTVVEQKTKISRRRDQKTCGKGRKNTRNPEREKQTEASETDSQMLATMSCEAEKDQNSEDSAVRSEEENNQEDLTREANDQSDLVPDSGGLPAGGKKKIRDPTNHNFGPQATNDHHLKNDTECFDLDLTDFEDEPLSAIQKIGDSSNLKNEAQFQDQELQSMCEVDSDVSGGTADDVNVSHSSDGNTETAGETHQDLPVPETDQVVEFSSTSSQKIKLKSLLKRKRSNDSRLKKSVRFAGLRARLSDIENDETDPKILKEESKDRRQARSAFFTDTTVTRVEAMFLADRRKMGHHDKSSEVEKIVTADENEDHFSSKPTEDPLFLEVGAGHEIDQGAASSETTIIHQNHCPTTGKSSHKQKKPKNKKRNSAVCDTDTHADTQNCRIEHTTVEDHKANTILQTREPSGENVLETKEEKDHNKETSKQRKKRKHSALPTIPEDGTGLVELINDEELCVEQNVADIPENTNLARSEISEDHKTDTALQTCGEIVFEGTEEKDHKKEMVKRRKINRKHSALPTVPEDCTGVELINEEMNVDQNAVDTLGSPKPEICEDDKMQKEDKEECSQRGEHAQQMDNLLKSDFPNLHSTSSSTAEYQLPGQGLSQTSHGKCSDNISKQSSKQKGKRCRSEPFGKSILHTDQPEEANHPKTKHKRNRTNSYAGKHDQQTSAESYDKKTADATHKRQRTSRSHKSSVLCTIPETCADMGESPELEQQNCETSALKTVPETRSDIPEKPSRSEHRKRKQRSSKYEDDLLQAITNSLSQSEQPMMTEVGMLDEKTEKSTSKKRKLRAGSISGQSGKTE